MSKRKLTRPTPRYRQHRSLNTEGSDIGKKQPAKTAADTKRKLILSKIEVGLLLLLFVVISVQLLDVGERPHIRLQPTSPFVDLADVSQLETEVHELINSTKLGSLQPFIPRTEIENLLSTKPYITDSYININVGKSRLDITVVPESPFAALTTVTDQRFVLTTAGHILPGFSVSSAPADIIDLHDPLDITGVIIGQDEPILSSEAVNFLIDLNCFFGTPDPRQLTRYCANLSGIPRLGIDRVELTGNPRQLSIYLSGSNLPESTRIVMSTHASAYEQGIAMSQTLEFFANGSEALPSEYIDVRLVGKVVYR